jgi:hypothetical protein
MSMRAMLDPSQRNMIQRFNEEIMLPNYPCMIYVAVTKSSEQDLSPFPFHTESTIGNFYQVLGVFPQALEAAYSDGHPSVQLTLSTMTRR